MAQVDVNVVQEKRGNHDSSMAPFHIPGGGVYPLPGQALENPVFPVRHLMLEIVPGSPTGWLGDGYLVLPIGLIVIGGSGEQPNLAGKRLRISVEEIEAVDP